MSVVLQKNCEYFLLEICKPLQCKASEAKISELKPPDKKNTTQQGGVLFCIQRFEQGMSKAKKRPSGAFSARLHRRGITIDATCPVPSIVPLPRKRLTFSATGSVSPLSESRCGNTASESLLLRQIKPPSFDGGFIFYSALSANWAFLVPLPSVTLPAAITAPISAPQVACMQPMPAP